MTRTELPAPYRWLLRLLPRPFRARHEHEIASTLAEVLDGRGRLARLGIWVRIAVDTIGVALATRVAGPESAVSTGAPGTGQMSGWWNDAGSACRALWRRPAASVVPALTLAIGIGATTTIFSAVHGVLLRPLPYVDADRIGILWHELGEGAQNLPALHAFDLYDYRDRSEVFDAFTVATGRRQVLGGNRLPELVDVGFVEHGFFEFFGARPALGRDFTEDEDRPGAAPVAILSDRLWQRRYGGDPGIVGEVVELEGRALRVIGVLPQAFRLHLPAEAFRLRDAEIWVPVAIDPARQPPRNFTGYTGFARLRAGATFAEGQAELEAMAATLRREHPEHASSTLRARVEPLHADVVKGARDRLVLLQGAVAFVLLIACANVANLLLVRGRARTPELQLRAALGAGAGRLARLVLFECVLLAAFGGAAGVLLSVAGARAIAALGRGTVPLVEGVVVDPTVLAFAVGVSMLAAVVFGALPALQAVSSGLGGVAGPSARTTATRRQRRLRDTLAMSEVALSLMLLVGTGLMIRSFAELSRVDPGYATTGVVTFTLSLPGADFPTPASRRALYDALTERLGALPGVTQVAGISQLPLAGSGPLQPYAYDAETAAKWESATADQRSVTPGFFDTIGATMLAGRDFTEDEIRTGRNVIVIDDRLAERAFPDGRAVGRQLQIEPNGTPDDQRLAEVVGVVRHLRLHDLARPHLTQIYFPAGSGGNRSFVLQASNGVAGLDDAIRREVAALAPGAPVADLRTIEERTHEALAPTRFALMLMLAFGTAAVALAAVGIYGVLSFTVTQRTREIGVRMALGQAPWHVRSEVLRHGARLVGLATLAGLAGAALVASAMSNLFFGVSPVDPATYVVASGSLALAALAACWIPAHRATRIDPVVALRTE